ncbi:hypothetical protein B0T21DRAFT_365298 [Apiosordaria backusii]|uniref:Uncharacterized protein n=1 Tax=Apiosordaria backusii TaxID=314023 RepID=A0AA40EH14_9PEZI|nr:hypothetical protein B0T21DRAFT_365298 [Apiosordaria backusii]
MQRVSAIGFIWVGWFCIRDGHLTRLPMLYIFIFTRLIISSTFQRLGYAFLLVTMGFLFGSGWQAIHEKHTQIYLWRIWDRRYYYVSNVIREWPHLTTTHVHP